MINPKSNGLTTPHSQPAETYKPRTTTTDYRAGCISRKVVSTQIAHLARAGYIVQFGPSDDYMVSKFGLTQYCQDLKELRTLAMRLGVSHG